MMWLLENLVIMGVSFVGTFVAVMLIHYWLRPRGPK